MSIRLSSAIIAYGLLLAGSVPASAQSVLERPPNLSGAWVGAPGVVHFNFLHRFNESGAPARKIGNSPSFLLAASLPLRLLVGAQYATNSDIAPSFPNEWEFFTRVQPLDQAAGAPLDLAVHGGFNVAAESVDGELTLARRLGPLRLLAVGRAMGNAYFSNKARYAIGGGATLRFGRNVALAGDVASLTSRQPDEKVAWGAGIQVLIPYTPHTLSLHAANTRTATLEGASRGGQRTSWGFEFTIPITLSRYFGQPAGPPPVASADTLEPTIEPGKAAPPGDTAAPRPAAADTTRPMPPPGPMVPTPTPPPPQLPEPPAAAPPAAQPDQPRPAAEAAQPQRQVADAAMRGVAFVPARITITAGTTVVWKNEDQVQHSVTADDKSFDSGIINPGGTYRRTFTRPGTYAIHCTPHPFMKGVVVVRAR